MHTDSIHTQRQDSWYNESLYSFTIQTCTVCREAATEATTALVRMCERVADSHSSQAAENACVLVSHARSQLQPLYQNLLKLKTFLERTANGDVVFTLKMGCPIEKFRVKLNSF